MPLFCQEYTIRSISRWCGANKELRRDREGTEKGPRSGFSVLIGPYRSLSVLIGPFYGGDACGYTKNNKSKDHRKCLI